ncbi:MAG: hypothetical protein ACK4SY_07390 [Pyrobaculum sp.]
MKSRIAIIMLAIVAIAAVAYVTTPGLNSLAEYYYNNSYFVWESKTLYAAMITDDGEVIEYINNSDGLVTGQAPRGGDVKPARAAEADPEAVKDALRRAGVDGELLGTYVYNSTHLVTLVENTDIYAVIWNNESAVAHKLKFEKYTEECRSAARKYDDYTFVATWCSVGYREMSGILPLYSFEDEAAAIWYTPAGYFKVAARGRFTIIYGVAVYVEDRSYREITDPTMYVCSFNSRTSGSGTPLAGVRAEGKAIQYTCRFPPYIATRLDAFAYISYDAWLIRSADARGSKNLVPGCIC